MCPLPEWLNPFQSSPKVEEVKSVETKNIISPTVSPINIQINEKVKKHFETLIENANLPGPDYKEFRELLKYIKNHL